MYILLNGAFGIGKTTTAKALVRRLDEARIYDPEPLGIAMQRASAYLSPNGRIDDFQDIAAWRHLTAWCARRRHRAGGTVIVPLAFSNAGYLDALVQALSGSATVHVLCLVTPLHVVRERLARRAQVQGVAIDGWAATRAEECCLAHRSPTFGRPIDASVPTEQIVGAVCALGLSE